MLLNAFSILGVPIDNFDATQFVEETLHLIEKYRKEHPRGEIATTTGLPTQYATPLDLGFLVNANGWDWKQARNPEPIFILRKSDIVVPDGSSIAHLSGLLGRRFKEKAKRANFILPLAKALGQRKKTVFLIGEEEAATEAADLLESQNPGVQVIGLASPQIHIQGEQLVEALQRDALIIEEINKASPDVLFVCLGHPKQEIWFERVRHKLQIPIAIGIGESFDMLTGKTKPSRLFSWNFIRSFGRNCGNFLTSLYLLIPLVIYHRLNQFVTWLGSHKDDQKVEKNLLFLSPNRSVAVIRLPVYISSDNCKEIILNMDEAFAQDVLILDAQKTKHIDIEGIALLVRAWQRAKEANKEFYGFGVKKRVSFLLSLHKVWDIFSNEICLSAADMANRLLHHTRPSSFYDLIYQKGDTMVLGFLGKLDNSQNYEEYLSKLVGMLDKDCLLDFTYCSFIDNAGFSFLLQLKQVVEGNDKTLRVTNVSKQLRRLFKLAKITKEFPEN